MPVLPVIGGNVALQGSPPLSARAADPGLLSERRNSDGERSSRVESFRRNLQVQTLPQFLVDNSSHIRQGSSSRHGSPTISRSPVTSRGGSKEKPASSTRPTSIGSRASRISSKEKVSSRSPPRMEIPGWHGASPEGSQAPSPASRSPAQSRQGSKGRSPLSLNQPGSILHLLHHPSGNDVSEVQQSIARARAKRYTRPKHGDLSSVVALNVDKLRTPSRSPSPERDPTSSANVSDHASKPGLLVHCLKGPNYTEASGSAPSSHLSSAGEEGVMARRRKDKLGTWPRQAARTGMVSGETELPHWWNAETFIVNSLAFLQDGSNTTGHSVNAIFVQQVNRLFAAGKRVLFMTNSASVSQKSHADQLAAAGIKHPSCHGVTGDDLSEAIAPHVITVGRVASWLLKQLERKKPFVVTGSTAFLSDLRRAGIENYVSTIEDAGEPKGAFLQTADQGKVDQLLAAASDVDAVIIGKDRELTAMKWIVAAQLAARKQLPLITCLPTEAKRKLQALAKGVTCRALCDKPGFDGSEFDLQHPSDCFIAALLSPRSEDGYGVEASQTVLLTSQVDDILLAKALDARSLLLAETVDYILMQAAILNGELDPTCAPTWSIPDWNAFNPSH